MKGEGRRAEDREVGMGRGGKKKKGRGEGESKNILECLWSPFGSLGKAKYNDVSPGQGLHSPLHFQHRAVTT